MGRKTKSAATKANLDWKKSISKEAMADAYNKVRQMLEITSKTAFVQAIWNLLGHCKWHEVGDQAHLESTIYAMFFGQSGLITRVQNALASSDQLAERIGKLNKLAGMPFSSVQGAALTKLQGRASALSLSPEVMWERDKKVIAAQADQLKKQYALIESYATALGVTVDSSLKDSFTDTRGNDAFKVNLDESPDLLELLDGMDDWDGQSLED
jgi:hypothetical protein